MVKRTLAMVGLLGAVLALGSGGAHAAGMNTVKGQGYSFQYSSTWQAMPNVPLTKLFNTKSLQHLAVTSNVVFTKDGYDSIAAFVQASAPSAAQLKTLERAMLSDSTALTAAPKYQNLAQNGVAFLSGSAVVKDHGKQIYEMVSAAQRHGKTFYFLAASQVVTGATAKAESNQWVAALNTIALH